MKHVKILEGKAHTA